MVLPPSLPLPRPKSPPELYGKRRELAKVLMLEREIRFLEDELKSVETLQPASTRIKEVADYVVTTPEPLIAVRRETTKSCGFWKWLLCGNSCFKFNMSCVCCCNGCSLEMPHCCSLPPDCCPCSLPKCTCAFNPPTCPTTACLKPCCLCCPNCNLGCWSDCSCWCKCWPSKCVSWPRCGLAWPTKCSCWPKCSRRRCCSLENNCCYSCCCQCC